MLFKITFLAAVAVFLGVLLTFNFAARGMDESNLKSRLLHQELILADTIAHNNTIFLNSN